MINFTQFAEWGYYALISGTLIQAVRVLTKLSASVETLNVNVAVIIEKTAQHEKRLDRHDSDIEKLNDNQLRRL